ncbi:pyridoxal phosphate-dependent aminotransferase [Colwellia sp. C1TZA3]|uniref:pyridoxal phosphate-dependent aminotransferase n=1 Tax=Colwellia sp. C1TZA3 TaxID=2508879 RepID=UPI0011B9E2FA|nr:pyridoxal phosphate-dependent aminotransferase [Colwellia sp. C1TZA3]TWX68934.1 pyridoxal phosphate-dependent aminotransferase [Colwellia sp. C1TZA3]
MPTYSLPKHIAYSQSLAAYIQHNLSDSTAQALTLAQLCQLGTADLGAGALGTQYQGTSEVETGHIGATLLSYSPVQGDVALRQEIVKFHQGLNYHSQIITADSVVTFCGAQEALSAIYQAVLSAGDEIVVMTPSYPSLVSMAKSMGVIVKEIALCADNHWQVNIGDFKHLVNERTQLIVLNSPHNPTGSIIDSELAEQILQLAQHYQCYLLSDDVSQASNYYDLALAHGYLDYSKSIVVGVMSKSLGLAGVRIGWAVTPDKTLLQSLMAIKAVHSICCSKIDEKLAVLALQNSQEILTNNNQLILDNIALFSALVARHPEKLNWHKPQAGILALVEVKNIDSIIPWSHQLAKQSGILALPSELFGLSGNYFRLGLGQKSFANILEKFEDYLLTTSTDSA